MSQSGVDLVDFHGQTPDLISETMYNSYIVDAGHKITIVLQTGSNTFAQYDAHFKVEIVKIGLEKNLRYILSTATIKNFCLYDKQKN